MMLVEYNGLLVPESYASATPEQRKAVCNGCGASGWKFDIVPDTIYGLDISEVCNIHDWCYHEGRAEEDKEAADMLFLTNLMRKIDDYGGWLAWLRRYRAASYYSAVVEFGHDAFWSGKA